MADGVPVHLSRIERLYIRCAPYGPDDLFARTQVVAYDLGADNPSDHIPVSMELARRRARHPMFQLPLSAALCRSEAFVGRAPTLVTGLPAGLGCIDAL